MPDTHHDVTYRSPTPDPVEGFDPDLPESPKHDARKFGGLSPVQVGASALAAVTSAVVASFFGVAGTLIGAAFGSIVSTVAGAMYAESLRRAGTRIRDTQAVVVQKVAGGTGDRPGAVAVVVAKKPWYRRPLLAGPLVGLAGFVIALGVIVLTETALGHPISGGTGGTSISRVVDTGSTPQETVTVTETVQPSAAATTPSAADPATASPSATAAPESTTAATPTAGATDAPEADATPDAAQATP